MSDNKNLYSIVRKSVVEKIPESVLNKTFYRFLFGFLTIIACTLVAILLVGAWQEA